MNDKRFKPLLDRQFLKAELDYQYRDYVVDAADEANHERLKNWAKRDDLPSFRTKPEYLARHRFRTVSVNRWNADLEDVNL